MDIMLPCRMATPSNPAKILDGMLRKLLKQIEAREKSAQAHLYAADEDTQQAKALRARYERLAAAQNVIEAEISGAAPESTQDVPATPTSMARFSILGTQARTRQFAERSASTRGFKYQVLEALVSFNNPEGVTAAEVAAKLSRDARNSHVSPRVLYSMTYVALRRFAEGGVLSMQRGTRGQVFSTKKDAAK